MEVVVNSERDRRTLEWLIAQAGEKAVEEACLELAGQRKPYVSNLAKVLGLNPPEGLLATPRSEAKSRLEAIKKLLKTRNS